MTTLRQQIGAALIARLAPTPGVARVIAPPGRILAAAELTALIVQVGEEQARTATKAARDSLLLVRRAQLGITALVLDGAVADGEMERIWGEAETRLATDWTLGGLLKGIDGFNFGPKLFDNFADRRWLVAQPAMEQTLTVEVTYYAQFGEPGVAR